ncbi:MAG: LysR family transcriptional regulator, partial [Oscillospiraceae bacterium]|nr:LysR family transcriptional regulator [Oscillospiraceae bacterium]
KAGSSMHLNQILTFLKVAECGSFAKAGEMLFISSSAVSQQISNLEESIGAQLLLRTTHGVALTAIGEYLKEEGETLVRKDREIQAHIQAMRFEEENCITLGTGMLQNCSLFYSFWGRFVAEHEGYQIRTIPLGDDFRLHREGQMPSLIESIQDGEPWQSEYSFLYLCDDRIVCAVPRAHPLADREVLTFESMRPYTLVTAPENLSPDLEKLTAEAAAAGITIHRAGRFNFPLFTECSLNNWLVQIPEAWAYLLTDFRIIPCEWDYRHAYGFFYREPVNRPLQLFLDFVRQERDSVQTAVSTKTDPGAGAWAGAG